MSTDNSEAPPQLQPEDVGLSSQRESFKTGSRFKRGTNNNTKNTGTRQKLKYQLERNQALWGDAARGDLASIKGCLEAGAQIDSIDRSSPDRRKHVTALMRAAGAGEVMVMATLIKLGANIEITNEQGWSALTVAAIMGRPDAIGVLVSRGMCVDQRCNGPGELTEFSALCWACVGGHLEAVQALLNRGADPTLTDSEGRSAAEIALVEEHPEVLAVLMDAVPAQIQLWLGSRSNDCDRIKSALEAGAVLDSVDERSNDPSKHMTALLIAAEQGHVESMELLLSLGSASASKASNGFTALHMAARSGELQAVQMCFREAVQCNVHAADANQDTALHHAGTSGSPHKRFVLEFLLGQGLLKSAKNAEGLNVIGAARKAKYHKVADWLEGLRE